MKKLYFLVLLLSISLNGFSQNVTITKVIETGCADPFVKSVELYVDGTVDFATDVVVNYMNNGQPWANNQIDVTGLGTVSNSFVYIVRDIPLMSAEFPSVTFTENVNTVITGTATNGDDGYQIVLNGTVVSQFGKTETDADNDTETDWNHADAVATRKNGVPDLGVWDRSHWDITAENDLDSHTSCENAASTNLETYFATLGSTYSLGSGSGWTPTAATCTAVLGNIEINCTTKTAGEANDTYSVTINFSGANTGNTFVITSTAGTVSGDNPGSTESGTIIVSDIPEGTDITVTAKDTDNGGVCDLSEMIESPICIPLLINEVLFDPAGDDAATADVVEGDANGDGIRDQAQDEFIEFYNNSNVALDISGYTISDGSALRHTFPASSIIPANEFLVVFGGGTPNTTSGYFGTAVVQTASEGTQPQLSLNNGGDVITIRNAANAIALVYDSNTTNIDHGENQSVTRSPDLTGDFVLHTTANANLLFSPGKKVDGTALSVSQNILENVSFYPNPVNKNSNNLVTISSNSTAVTTVKIYNVTGKMVKNLTVNNNQINVSNLASGLYLVKITLENKSTTKKLLIE
jgi:hypothetical protein